MTRLNSAILETINKETGRLIKIEMPTSKVESKLFGISGAKINSNVSINDNNHTVDLMVNLDGTCKEEEILSKLEEEFPNENTDAIRQEIINLITEWCALQKEIYDTFVAAKDAEWRSNATNIDWRLASLILDDNMRIVDAIRHKTPQGWEYAELNSLESTKKHIDDEWESYVHCGEEDKHYDILVISKVDADKGRSLDDYTYKLIDEEWVELDNENLPTTSNVCDFLRNRD